MHARFFSQLVVPHHHHGLWEYTYRLSPGFPTACPTFVPDLTASRSRLGELPAPNAYLHAIVASALTDSNDVI
jgi:hypothetical protein